MVIENLRAGQVWRHKTLLPHQCCHPHMHVQIDPNVTTWNPSILVQLIFQVAQAPATLLRLGGERFRVVKIAASQADTLEAVMVQLPFSHAVVVVWIAVAQRNLLLISSC